MEISAAAGQSLFRRPETSSSDGPGNSREAPGQQAKRAVAAAAEAGADLPKNAQGVAAAAIARGAEPSSVFAALVPPPAEPDPVGAPDAEVGQVEAAGEVPDTLGFPDAPSFEPRVAADAARREGEEIDTARLREQETAQAEALENRRGDTEAAETVARAETAAREDDTRPGGAVEATGLPDRTAETDAAPETDPAERETVVQREEAEVSEAALRAAGLDAIETTDAPAEAPSADAFRAAVAEREAAEEAAREAADARRSTLSFDASDAVRNAAETAYAEAIAGLLAQARGETTERVV